MNTNEVLSKPCYSSDMKILVAGGTGQLGSLLASHFKKNGHDVVTLSRSGGSHPSQRAWDGRNLGTWTEEVDGWDVVINLAGRSVNCRYTKDNLKQMMTSRIDATKVIGEAIAGGNQFVSWIHALDFVRSIDFLIGHEALDGPVNLASPNPLPQRGFMSALREAWGTRIGLPSTA